MKSRIARRLGLGGILVLLGGIAVLPAGEYHQIQKYTYAAAPGSKGEYFDYITMDSAARRVYLSRGTEIEVISADTGKEIGTITGLERDHGVAIAHDFNRGFISDGEQGKVIIFDLKTLRKTGEVNAEKDADCVAYDPFTKRVFVMEGDPESATVINARDGAVVKTIKLGGSPEFAVADGKGTVFINLESKNELIALDARTLEIKSRWSVAPAGGPTALAMDAEHHRLFTAGRKPQMLVVMDSENGKVVQSFPISGGVDAAVFEPSTGRIFASTREGKVHIFHEDTPDKYSEVETVQTEVGAKTMAVDTKTHNIFVDTADFTPPPAPTAERPHPRGGTVLGSFRVLVYGE
ncbi:MAG TPA: hypothetical protein VJN93_04585 [Candidatus Acidoferrum sp.]|nr:hypothetical protein [Candidatus Acidoferrum sp.]